MELDIEVKWTQEDIEKMLRARLAEEGFLLVPQKKQEPRKEKGKKAEEESPEDRYFVWPRGGSVKVKARAMISPRAQRAAVEPSATKPTLVDDDDSSIPRDMLPEGANVDKLEAAAKQRKRMPGESTERPED